MESSVGNRDNQRFLVQGANNAVKALQAGREAQRPLVSLRSYFCFFWARTLEPRSLRSE